MKTYMIVTNDEFELPISKEIIGAKNTAEKLGIKTQRLRRCLCKGFPKKSKYKAVVVKDKLIDDEKEYRQQYNKRYEMTHDRSEYYKKRYIKTNKS